MSKIHRQENVPIEVSRKAANRDLLNECLHPPDIIKGE